MSKQICAVEFKAHLLHRLVTLILNARRRIRLSSCWCILQGSSILDKESPILEQSNRNTKYPYKNKNRSSGARRVKAFQKINFKQILKNENDFVLSEEGAVQRARLCRKCLYAIRVRSYAVQTVHALHVRINLFSISNT